MMIKVRLKFFSRSRGREKLEYFLLEFFKRLNFLEIETNSIIETLLKILLKDS